MGGFAEPLSSGQQVLYGLFQLTVYIIFSFLMLHFVVSKQSVIPGAVLTSLIGVIHVLLTVKQCCDWSSEKYERQNLDRTRGIMRKEVLEWKIRKDKDISEERGKVLCTGAIDAVMLACGTSALMGLNAHSG